MGAAITGIFIGFIVPVFCFVEKEVNGVISLRKNLGGQ